VYKDVFVYNLLFFLLPYGKSCDPKLQFHISKTTEDPTATT